MAGGCASSGAGCEVVSLLLKLKDVSIPNLISLPDAVLDRCPDDLDAVLDRCPDDLLVRERNVKLSLFVKSSSPQVSFVSFSFEKAPEDLRNFWLGKSWRETIRLGPFLWLGSSLVPRSGSVE